MSKIYLPNGGHIVIHNEGWKQTTDPHTRETSYYDKKLDTFLGTITAAGVVHLTNACRHTYYPPGVDSLDQSFDILMNQIKQLPYWKTRNLKKLLNNYNSKSCTWK